MTDAPTKADPLPRMQLFRVKDWRIFWITVERGINKEHIHL